ncbi:MAG: carbamoyl phosphate synthase small subunit [Firmicutes bacterium]|nr:carbamoyl phosphate synthase small subunit [Bacillota bacterium]
MKAFLVLDDGTIFEGISAGAQGTAIGEIVFNTSMTGYQEIITDPSNWGQIVLMTYPLIGNYGINDQDGESGKAQAGGLIVRELCKEPSNHRMTQPLGDYLKESGIVAIEGIDTRQLTKEIRKRGVVKGAITTDCDFDVKRIDENKVTDAVRAVTCKKQYQVGCDTAKYNVALIDLGTKKSVITTLTEFECKVTVMPAYTAPKTIIEGGFDGVVLSGGPGNPKECNEIIENIKELQKTGIPIFGIGLGHLLMALASGFDTERMANAHNGANYPVVRAENGASHITVQNHKYVVLSKSVDKEKADITHYNLNDNSVEGIGYKKFAAFSVQFYPGKLLQPFDTGYLFLEFVKYMKAYKKS